MTQQQELIILSGNIGCGKSLVASKLAKKGYVAVNNDAIVTTLHGGEYDMYDVKKRDIYWAAESCIINKALGGGFNVVIDRTSMSVSGRKRFIDIGKAHGVKIRSIDWGAGSNEDLDRRLKNPRGVTCLTWSDVHDHMFASYEKPSMAEGFSSLEKGVKRYKFYAIDFDGTIVENEFPAIGAIRGQTWVMMKKLWEDMHNIIIIWTCRSGESLNHMRKFLIDEKIPFDFINENPLFDPGSRKIFAHEYFDDRNSQELQDVKSGI